MRRFWLFCIFFCAIGLVGLGSVSHAVAADCSTYSNPDACSVQQQVFNAIQQQITLEQQPRGFGSWLASGVTGITGTILQFGLNHLFNYNFNGTFSKSAFLESLEDGLVGSNLMMPLVTNLSTQFYSIATKQFSGLAVSVFNVLQYVFMIWIIVQCLYLMLGLQGIRQVAWAITTRSGIFMILMSLLGISTTATYWNGFVSEPIELSAQISSAMMNAGGVQVKSCSDPSVLAGFPSSYPIVRSVSCLAEDMEEIMKPGIEIGYSVAFAQSAFFQSSLQSLSGPGILFTLFAFITGMVLVVVFGMAIIYYTFFLIDLVIKICMISAFAPFFIAFYLLPVTRGYSKQAFNHLFGSFVTLTTAGLVLGFISAIMGNILGDASQPNSTLGLVAAGNLTAVDSGYWSLLMLGMAIILVTRRIVEMINRIFGVSYTSFLANTATQTAQAAVTGTAVMATTLGTAGVGGVAAMSGVPMAAKGLGMAYRGGRNLIQRARN